MENLTKLFKLLQLTRSMPQSGYSLLSIPKGQLSDLAQHQYLVTFIAWQLALGANRAGASLNVQKVMEIAMVHDVGELFGSDIAMPYAAVNKRAKKLAKAFEAENQKYIANKFFGIEAKNVKALFNEVMDYKTDEGRVAKAADYLECAHYRLYMEVMDKADFKQNIEKINTTVVKIKDPAAKKYLTEVIKLWEKEFFKAEGKSAIMRSLLENGK